MLSGSYLFVLFTYMTYQYCVHLQVQVKIRANVYAITDIDNVKQEFTATLSIRARWKEPLMAGLCYKLC